jgi:GntR family transcriptional regulator, rspAB operon transcriptional repressor
VVIEQLRAALALELTGDEPLPRQLLRSLRRAIITMAIPPGEMLSEQDIAQCLGISRQPVREALFKLREATLIKVLPQRGTLVLKISREAVENAQFIREAVECATIRRAAELMTPTALAALAACIVEQEEAASGQKIEEFFALDEKFHRLIAEAAGRPTAWNLVEDLKPQMDRVRYLTIEEIKPRQTIIRHHRAIHRALTEGDVDEAESVMRTHVRAILLSLPRMEKQFPSLFSDARA